MTLIAGNTIGIRIHNGPLPVLSKTGPPAVQITPVTANRLLQSVTRTGGGFAYTLDGKTLTVAQTRTGIALRLSLRAPGDVGEMDPARSAAELTAAHAQHSRNAATRRALDSHAHNHQAAA